MLDPVVVIISRIVAPPIDHRSLVLVLGLLFADRVSDIVLTVFLRDSLKSVKRGENTIYDFNPRLTIKLLGRFNATEIESERQPEARLPGKVSQMMQLSKALF